MTNRYENGKIYSIRSHQTQDVYIGSTCLQLTKRLSQHRANYKRYKEGNYHFITAYDILKYDDYYIELIEDCKCETKPQLERREGQVIREAQNCINARIAGRTKREHYEDTKEHVAERDKQYRANNKEVIARRKKQYAENNKEIIAIKHKQYALDNKVKLAEQNREKYVCECGGKYTHANKAVHLRALKHIAYEANKPP